MYTRILSAIALSTAIAAPALAADVKTDKAMEKSSVSSEISTKDTMQSKWTPFTREGARDR